MVIYQLLRGVSTNKGRGEAGPRGTGRNHSAAQAATLAAKAFTEAINPHVPKSGRPISGDQARVSSPASCRAGAKDLNNDAELCSAKGFHLLKYPVLAHHQKQSNTLHGALDWDLQVLKQQDGCMWLRDSCI